MHPPNNLFIKALTFMRNLLFEQVTWEKEEETCEESEITSPALSLIEKKTDESSFVVGGSVAC